MDIAILVPARVASTRFPQKLLHEVQGKPVILWTADRIRGEALDLPLHFAVDDRRLFDILDGAGYQAIMTDAGHSCGTDRIAEANRELGAEHVINVQADEPMVTGDQIRMLADLIRGEADMATLGSPLRDDSDYRNSNHVKVVYDESGHALYFSRAPIPYFRDTHGVFDPALADDCPVLIHLGLYAYTASFLQTFSDLPPGRLEQLEKLEMLRALENGYRIAIGVSEDPLIEIDTPEQAVQFEQVVKERFPAI